MPLRKVWITRKVNQDVKVHYKNWYSLDNRLIQITHTVSYSTYHSVIHELSFYMCTRRVPSVLPILLCINLVSV